MVDKTAAMAVVNKAAFNTGLIPQQILGGSRVAKLSKVRHAVWWILGSKGMSRSAIAKMFRRDPSTIYQGIKSADPAWIARADPEAPSLDYRRGVILAWAEELPEIRRPSAIELGELFRRLGYGPTS